MSRPLRFTIVFVLIALAITRSTDYCPRYFRGRSG